MEVSCATVLLRVLNVVPLLTAGVKRATKLREKLEKAGRDMLENMKETEGVKELEGGVLLHILEHGLGGAGKGVQPTVGSTVTIHYHGSYERTLISKSCFRLTLLAPTIRNSSGWNHF